MKDQGVCILTGLVFVKLAVHLALSGEYGYHRDELYFIECGRHLAWGYVDHPPLIGWIAALAGALFDHSLLGLRLFSTLAGGGAVLLCGLLVRELGGDWFAQVLAGVAMLLAPAFLRMGIMLNIVVFEPLFWTVGALLVVRILRGGSARLWLGVGVVVGIGLLNKHTMALWAVGLAVGLLCTPARRQLREPRLWLGVALAAAIAAPNLVWQANHDWATLEFIRTLREGILAAIPRHLFVLGQLLYMSPITLPLWGAGLWWLLFSERGRPYRALGVQFLTIAGVLVFSQAKPYYLSAAYPVLFAAGAVAAEQWMSDRPRRRVGAVVALVVCALPLAILSLPIAALQRVDRTFDAVLGGIVPPLALTHDLHDQYGWREKTQTVAEAFESLSPRERETATILAGNYGQTSAINFFGPRLGLPRAVSGHMTYYLWGPDPQRQAPVIMLGVPPRAAALVCEHPREAGRADHPLAVPFERNLPVLVCDAPRAALTTLWPQLKSYTHGSHARELID